jgi:hypothetical protein
MARALAHISRIALALAVIAVVAVLWARLFAGTTRQYALSPDGKSIAEYREYRQGSATTTDLGTVELKSRLNPIRHTVLSGPDYGANLSLTWVDSRNLIVECEGCSAGNVVCHNCTALDIVKKESRWHDISIHYALH